MPSEAVLYRKIQQDRPTLLLDEYDAIFGNGREHEPLRALLNAGNEADTIVPRCGGANRDKLEEFSVWCPKALAGLGRLPDTIEDRAIPIQLSRKAPGEHAERARRGAIREAAEPLRARLEEWAATSTASLRGARPTIPEELDDRAQDGWEPLLAIADLADSDWSSCARRAALTLSAGEQREDDAVGVRLLIAIHGVFEDEGDRIFTRRLIEALGADDEAPWSDWWDPAVNAPARGAARRLATLLRDFDIRSQSVRVGSETARGYKAEQFEDAFCRYLPLPEKPIHPPLPPHLVPLQVCDVSDVSDVTQLERNSGAADVGELHRR
jgi:hypothetical protein